MLIMNMTGYFFFWYLLGVKLTRERPQNKILVPFRGHFEKIRRAPLSFYMGNSPPPTPPPPPPVRITQKSGKIRQMKAINTERPIYYHSTKKHTLCFSLDRHRLSKGHSKALLCSIPEIEALNTSVERTTRVEETRNKQTRGFTTS